MTGGDGRPTIRTVRTVDVDPAPLGVAGVQRVLFGAPRADGSPVLMGVSHVRRGMTSSLIQHETAEIAYVLTGDGWMVTDDTEHPFIPGEGLLIEAGCWHAIRAGDEPVEMLFVFPTPTVPVTHLHPSEEQ